ncbi:MAG: MarR family transcriptional regulator [Planctomycetes bacterium]|nr:MarR family transcriptional regulator [Planctomycetota bacterium]
MKPKTLSYKSLAPADNPLRELIRAFGLLERIMQPYFARFGISGSQWGILRNLHRAEEEGLRGLRLTELSQRLLIRPPSVTGLVDRMVRSGLVARDGSTADLRVKEVQLTRMGRKLVERILEGHQDQVNILLAGLGDDDQKDLMRLLSKWRDHLENVLQGETTLRNII